MGGKNATAIQTSFFSVEEQERLKQKFSEFISGADCFYSPELPELSPKLTIYITKHLKSQKDFKSFVGIIEYLIYGKSTNIILPNLPPLEILINLLNLPESTLTSDLLQYLLIFSAADSSILPHITPPSASPSHISNYLTHNFPFLTSSFSRFLRFKLFQTSLPSPPIPKLPNHHISRVLTLLYYSCYNLSSAAQEIHPIFLSDKDGLSFNRLAAAIAGYTYPMILVLRLYGDDVLGAYIGENVKDNAMISGSMDTFLYTLVGGFKTFKPEYGDGAGKYVYLNSKLNNSEKFPKGIGFGGGKDDARLWIDADLDENSYVSSTCGTYQAGQLVNQVGNMIKIMIVCIEIWGCGGDKALEMQQKLRKGEDTRITHSRKVDKTQLVSGAFNREVLLGNTFQNSKYKEG